MHDEDVKKKLGTCLSAAAIAVVVMASCFSPTMAEDEFGRFAYEEVILLEDEDEEHRRIQAYCRTSWRNSKIRPDNWDDCTQEVFVRLYGSLSRAQIFVALKNPDSMERRELNRAVWATAQRCRRQRPHRELADLGQYEDDRDQGDWPQIVQRLELVRAAVRDDRTKLTLTQRAIMEHSEKGRSVAEIASTLGLNPERVSDEKYKAIRKLKTFFDHA